MAAKKRDASINRAKMSVKVGILSRATLVATKESPQKTVVATSAPYVFNCSCSDIDPFHPLKKEKNSYHIDVHLYMRCLAEPTEDMCFGNYLGNSVGEIR